MNISKGALALTKLASTRHQGRASLERVAITGDRIEATNGHALGRVMPSPENTTKIAVCVPASDIERAVKAMGKAATITLDVPVNGVDATADTQLVRFITDGTTCDLTGVPFADSGFPITNMVFPAGPPTHTVCVDAAALRHVLDVVIAVAGRTRSESVPMTIDLFNVNQPIRLTPKKNVAGEESVFLLMPIRGN